jgi:hypothetical protein
MEWKLIATAPFDRDLELAVVGDEGARALAFPCRRITGGGWIGSAIADAMLANGTTLQSAMPGTTDAK